MRHVPVLSNPVLSPAALPPMLPKNAVDVRFFPRIASSVCLRPILSVICTSYPAVRVKDVLTTATVIQLISQDCVCMVCHQLLHGQWNFFRVVAGAFASACDERHDNQ